MTDYRLDTNGPHSDDYTRHVADALAESVRVLNHATLLQGETRDPATVHHVLGALHDAVARMDQLLRQLDDRLHRMHRAGRLGDVSGDPDRALAFVRQFGSEAHAASRVLSEKLAATYRAASGLYLRDEDGGQ